MTDNSPRGENYSYSLRSDCVGEGQCSCTNTLELHSRPRSALRCRNSRNIDENPVSTSSSLTTPICNGWTSPHVSSLRNGSSTFRLQKHRVHFHGDLHDVTNSNGISLLSQENYLNPSESVSLTNGHAIGTNIEEMSTTSSTTKITRKFTTQKYQHIGGGDGSYISISNSNKSFNDEKSAHPGYRNRSYVSETVESGSGKGLASDKYKNLNGSALAVSDDDDDFLHRKATSNFRHRYTSDGFDIGQTEQTFLKKASHIPIIYLSKIAWYIYSAIVHVLVFEKWFLKRSNNSTYNEDLYFENKRMGYALNGTNEGSSSKFRHLFFSNKKLVANHNDSVDRRNVMVFNNSSETKSTKSTYNNSQHNEDHLSEEEHFTSSWTRSRGLAVGVGCLKVVTALLLLAFLGYLGVTLFLDTTDTQGWINYWHCLRNCFSQEAPNYCSACKLTIR